MADSFFELVTTPESAARAYQFAKEPPRALRLNPEDLLWAPWRNVVLEKPSPRPFSLSESQARWQDATSINWYQAPLHMVLSADEAVFHLSVMMGKGKGDSALYAAYKAKLGDSDKLTASQLKEIVAKSRFDNERAVALIPMQILAALLPVEDLVGWLCESTTILSAYLEFRKRVLLYMPLKEREKLKARIRPFLETKNWSSERNMAYYLAAALGMNEEVRELVESWSDEYARGAWHLRFRVLQYIIFGLTSPQEVEKHMRRLNLVLDDPQFILGWLAHTEHHAIDMVVPALSANLREEAKLPQLLAALANFDAPEVAPVMFECATKYRAIWQKEPRMHLVASATEWLARNKTSSAIGLAPLVEVASPKDCESILAYLRQMARDGNSAEVESALTYFVSPSKRVKEEVLEAGSNLPPQFDKASTPKWFPPSSKDPAKGKMPDWLVTEELPPVLVGAKRLNTDQTYDLIAALRSATASNTDPLIPLLRQHGDAESLEKFVLAILSAWTGAGAPNSDRWVIHAVGQLGGNQAALLMPPLIRNWRANSNQPHALAGLECLKTIGTDTALMQLNVIATDQRLKALKEKAVVFMQEIAAGLGLSRERLEDRLISKCGLEECSKAEFDQLSRKSTEVKATLKAQTERLQLALVGQRRWFTDEFETLLLKHPIMGHLVRKFLWGGFDKSGRLTGLFRISVDGNCTDEKHQPVALQDFAEIGLVHPLQLTDANRESFIKLFDELELEQPFPQLKRVVHELTEEERSQTEFLRLKDYILPAQSVPAVLDKRGWVRGVVESGMFNEFVKYFATADVTAVCVVDIGVPVYFDETASDVHMDHVIFVPGKIKLEQAHELGGGGGMPLGDVDPIVVSEVLNDLFELSKKAKSHAYE